MYLPHPPQLLLRLAKPSRQSLHGRIILTLHLHLHLPSLLHIRRSSSLFHWTRHSNWTRHSIGHASAFDSLPFDAPSVSFPAQDCELRAHLC